MPKHRKNYQAIAWLVATYTFQALNTAFNVGPVRSFCQLRGKQSEGTTFGWCNKRGDIRIGLRCLKTGKLLEHGEIIDTVCHELAHLKFLDHKKQWKETYHKYCDYVRRFL